MPNSSAFTAPITAPAVTPKTISAADFVEPSWVKNARQTIGTDVEPVYPMKTVHDGNQVPDTSAAPIGYRYDNGKSQYQYLDLAGAPTNLVNRGNLGEAIKTLSPIAMSMIGANFLGPALNDLFGGTTPLTKLMGSDTSNVFDLVGNGEFAAGGGGAGITNLGTDVASNLGTNLTDAGTNLANVGTNLADTTTNLTGQGLTQGAGQQGLKAVLNTGGLAGDALTAGLPVVEGMGGGTGLTALSNIGGTAGGALTAGLPIIEGMGGAGLTTAAAGGGTVGAGGVTAGGGTTVGAGGVIDAAAAADAAAKAKAAADAAAAAGTADAAAKAKAAADAKALADAAGGGSNLLKTLTDATGLTGTQLAALLSGLTGAGNAANLTNAINTGLDATTAANTASQGVLKDIYNQQLGFQKPYQTTGTNALSQLGALGTGQYQQYDPTTGLPTTIGTGSGYLQHQFDASDLAKGLAPNYDFMLQQGQMANQRAANVGGGALSGNTLQGLNKYTQDYAGTAYQNAFNNYQNQRQNIYQNLSGLAGMGQTANTGAQAAGTSYGKGTTDLQTALANAQAAAAVGKAQAVAGGTSNLANSTFLASLLAPPK